MSDDCSDCCVASRLSTWRAILGMTHKFIDVRRSVSVVAVADMIVIVIVLQMNAADCNQCDSHACQCNLDDLTTYTLLVSSQCPL